MKGEDANAAFYDADSSTYDDARWTSGAGARTNRIQQRIVQDLCADWSHQRVLEVGPGTGRFTIPLTRKGNRLTLVDVSNGMLETARKNLEAAGLGGQVDDCVNGSIYELPFADNTFDHAVSINVFNHLERAGAALKELARVTRPGSTLLFNHANQHSYYWLAGKLINRRSSAIGQSVYSRWEKPAAVRRMIDEAGLDLVRHVGHVHTPRAIEKCRLDLVTMLLDAASRRGPLHQFAPVHFCLCRKPGVTGCDP
ncbi:MAG: class I SAM-dependent methyltransferase [Planctomycetota bacterium]